MPATASCQGLRHFALASDGCSNQSIAPAASCTVEVTLAPAALGPSTAQLEVPSNAPSNPDAVALDGTGVAPAAVLFTPSPLAFGSVALGSQTTQVLTVENTGAGSLQPGAVTITGPDAAAFSIDSSSCSGAQLAQGESCDITLSFAPSAAGVSQASLQLESNAPSSPDVAALEGSTIEVFANGFEGG